MAMGRKYIRDKRSPSPKTENVSKVMSQNRAKDTGPEKLLRKALRAQGVSGYRLHPKQVPGRPDICFLARKLAIFVNGCFWHSCPKCKTHTPKHNTEFWVNKFKANKERDTRKTAILEDMGWTVITIWECDLKKNLDLVVKIVQNKFLISKQGAKNEANKGN